MKLITKKSWRKYLSSSDDVRREYDRVRLNCFFDGEDVDIFYYIYRSCLFGSSIFSNRERDILYDILVEDLGF